MAIETIGVVGAGFMGTGIAESAARAGLTVHLYEPQHQALERSRSALEASVAHAVTRGKLDQTDADALIGRVHPTTSMHDLAPAQLVVEAIVEDPHVKGQVFRDLDAALPDAQLLASNTSSIPIAQIASWTQRPDRVCGLHFFSPVPVMKLVEIVVALDTSRADRRGR